MTGNQFNIELLRQKRLERFAHTNAEKPDGKKTKGFLRKLNRKTKKPKPKPKPGPIALEMQANAQKEAAEAAEAARQVMRQQRLQALEVYAARKTTSAQEQPAANDKKNPASEGVSHKPSLGFLRNKRAKKFDFPHEDKPRNPHEVAAAAAAEELREALAREGRHKAGFIVKYLSDNEFIQPKDLTTEENQWSLDEPAGIIEAIEPYSFMGEKVPLETVLFSEQPDMQQIAKILKYKHSIAKNPEQKAAFEAELKAALKHKECPDHVKAEIIKSNFITLTEDEAEEYVYHSNDIIVAAIAETNRDYVDLSPEQVKHIDEKGDANPVIRQAMRLGNHNTKHYESTPIMQHDTSDLLSSKPEDHVDAILSEREYSLQSFDDFLPKNDKKSKIKLIRAYVCDSQRPLISGDGDATLYEKMLDTGYNYPIEHAIVNGNVQRIHETLEFFKKNVNHQMPISMCHAILTAAEDKNNPLTAESLPRENITDQIENSIFDKYFHHNIDDYPNISLLYMSGPYYMSGTHLKDVKNNLNHIIPTRKGRFIETNYQFYSKPWAPRPTTSELYGCRDEHDREHDTTLLSKYINDRLNSFINKDSKIEEYIKNNDVFYLKFFIKDPRIKLKSKHIDMLLEERGQRASIAQLLIQNNGKNAGNAKLTEEQMIKLANIDNVDVSKELISNYNPKTLDLSDEVIDVLINKDNYAISDKIVSAYTNIKDGKALPLKEKHIIKLIKKNRHDIILVNHQSLPITPEVLTAFLKNGNKQALQKLETFDKPDEMPQHTWERFKKMLQNRLAPLR